MFGGITPEVGMTLMSDLGPFRVSEINGSEITVDFNHALAGVTLRYKYKIIKEVTDRSEKVTTLLETNTGRDGFECSFDGDDLTITLPEYVSYDQNWAYTKFGLIRTLRDHVGVQTIVFREVHAPMVADEPESEDSCELSESRKRKSDGLA